MTKNSPLYNALNEWLGQSVPWVHRAHLTTCLWMVVALLQQRNTWIWRVGHGWCQLKDIHLQRGEALCWHTVKLHKGEWYGSVHVAFGRNSVNGEFWAIVSDEPTSLHTFEEYGLCFDIEEAFLDDQSNGWNLQKRERVAAHSSGTFHP